MKGKNKSAKNQEHATWEGRKFVTSWYTYISQVWQDVFGEYVDIWSRDWWDKGEAVCDSVESENTHSRLTIMKKMKLEG